MYHFGGYQEPADELGPSASRAFGAHRPWSPPVDQDVNLSRGVEDYLRTGGAAWPPAAPQRHRTNFFTPRRREASDVSVEALDLADYAMTLRQRGPESDPYESPFDRHNDQPHHRSAPLFPPATASGSGFDRPYSAQSRDTAYPPPSLVSGGATSVSSHGNDSPYAIRRPQSLPPVHSANPFSVPRMPAIFAAQRQHPAAPASEPTMDHDVRQFPAWSRGWYEQRGKQAEEPGYRPFSPQTPPSEFGVSPYQFPAAAGSQRDLLPWSAERDGPGHQVTESVKEERMKMLEREFGGEGKRSKFKDDEEGIIGSVDQTGKLITAGPVKRTAMRWLQGVLALGSAGSGLYAALYVKPNPPAPAAGKPATILLYVLACLSLVVIIYFFAIRPFCCGARSRKFRKEAQAAENGVPGMMVLPVATPGAGGKKPKNNKKGKKGKKGQAGEPGSVQVNLIVDPTMFGSGRGRRDESSDDEDEMDMPGDYEGSSNRSRRSGGAARQSRGPKRRSVFAGLALEARWKRARNDLKWNTGVDAIMMLLWAAEFIAILLMNKTCPPGGFEAWCDGYNVAVAGACLLAFAFAISLFLDIKDLHASSQSPRTKT